MESRKKITELLKLIMCFLIVVTSACSARKGVPYSEPLALEEQELKNGQVLFNGHCNSCHPGGSSGLGPAINNKLLPKFLMRFQMRHGLGVMPAFKEEALTDEEVKNIAKYLVHLRKNG